MYCTWCGAQEPRKMHNKGNLKCIAFTSCKSVNKRPAALARVKMCVSASPAVSPLSALRSSPPGSSTTRLHHMPGSSHRVMHLSPHPTPLRGAHPQRTACCTSTKRRESIRSRMQRAARLLQLLPGELNKGLAEERTQRRTGRQHCQRPKRLLLQKVPRLLQGLLLRQAGVVGPRQHQIQIEALLRLHGHGHRQQGRQERRVEEGR